MSLYEFFKYLFHDSVCMSSYILQNFTIKPGFVVGPTLFFAQELDFIK
ncbi:hypothetical protein LEP1GSC166_3524 [Leptospira kirschneri]|nr:hypothetical protein LEP1GSC166_3524 [Leptospira kirschneri]